MEVPEVERLTRYWNRHPPLPVVLRMALGVKEASRPSTKGRVSTKAELVALAAEMEAAFGGS